MKWDKIKNQVVAYVRTSIIEARDWDTMAVILTDILASDFKLLRETQKQRYWELATMYADKAAEVIDNWDIRMVGKLRELFPGYFPKTLSKGPLVCGYDADGDWVVERELA